jgi:hypothetical protein
MSRWTSADTNADRASAGHTDKRTPAQRSWDDHSATVAEYAARIRALTQTGSGWARDPRALEVVSSIASDMARELQVLRIEGYREGDTVRGVAAPVVAS